MHRHMSTTSSGVVGMALCGLSVMGEQFFPLRVLSQAFFYVHQPICVNVVTCNFMFVRWDVCECDGFLENRVCAQV